MPRLLVVAILALAGCAVRLPEAGDCDPASAGRPVCGLQNPEDVLALPGTRWVLASQLRRPSTRIAFACLDGAVRNCGQPWSVLAVDPNTLAITTMAKGDGREFGAASSAVLVGDTLVVGTWSGDRVLRRALR